MLDELIRFYSLAGWKPHIDLNPKQIKIWEGLLRKAGRNPSFDYARDIGVNRAGEATFKGQVITTTAKRRMYRKKDNLNLDLEKIKCTSK